MRNSKLDPQSIQVMLEDAWYNPFFATATATAAAADADAMEDVDHSVYLLIPMDD